MKRVLACIVVLIVLVGGYFAYKSSSGVAKSSAGDTSQGFTASGGQMGGSQGSGRFAELQKEHKYAFQMLKQLNSIRRLEESGKEPLTKAQAKSILAIVQPLREKKTLDETSAEDAVKALQAVITDKQRSVISALPAEQQFRQGGPPQGMPSGRRQGGPPPGAGGPGGMKNFNPLNRPAGGPPGMQGQRRGGIEKLLDDLKKKSGD
ncbi:MAG: hypothetical protein ABFD64_13080 [Armatimonadota bacterium]